jgi:hypothetical protein
MTETKLSHELSHVNSRNVGSDWDAVIADAEEELRATTARRTALKASIELFKKKKEAGEPLPPDLERFRLSTQN